MTETKRFTEIADVKLPVPYIYLCFGSSGIPDYRVVEPKGFKKVNLGESRFKRRRPIDPYFAVKRLEKIIEQLTIKSEKIIFEGSILLSDVSHSEKDERGSFYKSRNGFIRLYTNLEHYYLGIKTMIDRETRFIDILKDLVESGRLGPSFYYERGIYSQLTKKEDCVIWRCHRGLLGARLELEETEEPFFVYVEGYGKREYKQMSSLGIFHPYSKSYRLFCGCSYNPKERASKTLKRIIESSLKIK